MDKWVSSSTGIDVKYVRMSLDATRCFYATQTFRQPSGSYVLQPFVWMQVKLLLLSSMGAVAVLVMFLSLSHGLCNLIHVNC